MKRILILLVATIALLFSSCTDADVASNNLSKAADQFEIYRRVVFLNGITDTYILQIEGYCSVNTINGRLSVIVKVDEGKYLKHYLGLSDNVTYFAEQLDAENINTGRYRVIFKPSAIIPKIDVE